MLFGTVSETPVINNVHCFVGYGIDILDAEAPSTKCLRGNWLTPCAFQKDANGYRLVQTTGNQHTMNVSSLSYTGESVSELLGGMNISAGVEVKVPFFSGNIEAKYGIKNEQKETSKYAMINTYLDLQTFIIDSSYIINPMDLVSHGYMDPRAINQINKSDIEPKALFRNYGTHMIIHQSTGATANIFYNYRGSLSISSTEFTAAVTAGSAYFSGNGGVSLEGNNKTITENSRLLITAWGGNAAEVIGSNIDEAKRGFNEWKTSLTEKTATLSSIQSVMPIWLFAKDANRRAEIIDAFYKNVRDRQIALDDIYKNSYKSYISDIRIFNGYSEEQVKEAISIQGYHSFVPADCWVNNPNVRYFGYQLTNEIKEAITDIIVVDGINGKPFDTKRTFDVIDLYGNKVSAEYTLGAQCGGQVSSPVGLYYIKDNTIRKPVLEICCELNDYDYYQIGSGTGSTSLQQRYYYNPTPSSPVNTSGWEAAHGSGTSGIKPIFTYEKDKVKKIYTLYVRR